MVWSRSARPPGLPRGNWPAADGVSNGEVRDVFPSSQAWLTRLVDPTVVYHRQREELRHVCPRARVIHDRRTTCSRTFQRTAPFRAGVRQLWCGGCRDGCDLPGVRCIAGGLSGARGSFAGGRGDPVDLHARSAIAIATATRTGPSLVHQSGDDGHERIRREFFLARTIAPVRELVPAAAPTADDEPDW